MENAVQGYKDRSHIFDISAAITYLPEATQQFVQAQSPIFFFELFCETS